MEGAKKKKKGLNQIKIGTPLSYPEQGGQVWRSGGWRGTKFAGVCWLFEVSKDSSRIW